MKFIIIPLFLALAACGNLAGSVNSAATVAASAADAAGLPSPSSLTDQTKLDEQVAIGAEAMYKGARLLVEPLVDVGIIRGQTAERFRVLNREAFDAVRAVRAAYDTGNARSYAAAAERASGAISKLLALAK